MSIVLDGIKLGIVLAFLIGPVFFAIIQTSIERGFTKGVLICLGVSLNDVLYVIICYLGLIQLIESARFREQMADVGGAILILFGLYHLLIKSRKKVVQITASDDRSGLRYFLKGFLINAFSPMVPLFWIGTISVASIDLGLRLDSEFVLFYAATLSTVLLTDIAKAYLAGRLRRLITPKLMMWLNIVVGLALVVFGIRLIVIANHLTL